jgi:predicted DNA-binding transcriptional regulator AlpA
MIAALAGLEIALAARLLNVAPATNSQPASAVEDRMLTVKECAERLRRSIKWVYRRVKTLPFARKLDNRAWVFSEKGLEKWLSQRRA